MVVSFDYHLFNVLYFTYSDRLNKIYPFWFDHVHGISIIWLNTVKNVTTP